MQARFYKYAKDVQLAHLYEHIFLISLSDYLRSMGYLSFLDYDIRGFVNSDALITLEISCKNYLADIIKSFLNNQLIEFSDDAIAAATIQMFAEKKVESDGFEDDIVQELKAINSLDWADVMPSNRKLATYDRFLNLYDVDEPIFFNDVVKFKFAVDKKGCLGRLLLFVYLSRILINTTNEIIENDFYASCVSVNDEFTSDLFVATSVLTNSRRQPKYLRPKINKLNGLVKHLASDSVINRIITDLSNNVLPVDAERVSDLLGVAIDGDSYKKYINKAEIINIIKCIELDIKQTQ